MFLSDFIIPSKACFESGTVTGKPHSQPVGVWPGEQQTGLAGFGVQCPAWLAPAPTAKPRKRVLLSL